jgi:hypothetical protein
MLGLLLQLQLFLVNSSFLEEGFAIVLPAELSDQLPLHLAEDLVKQRLRIVC